MRYACAAGADDEGQGLALCKEADFMAGIEAAMKAAGRTVG